MQHLYKLKRGKIEEKITIFEFKGQNLDDEGRQKKM